jgi:hypothetical protein
MMTLITVFNKMFNVTEVDEVRILLFENNPHFVNFRDILNILLNTVINFIMMLRYDTSDDKWSYQYHVRLIFYLHAFQVVDVHCTYSTDRGLT